MHSDELVEGEHYIYVLTGERVEFRKLSYEGNAIVWDKCRAFVVKPKFLESSISYRALCIIASAQERHKNLPDCLKELYGSTDCSVMLIGKIKELWGSYLVSYCNIAKKVNAIRFNDLQDLERVKNMLFKKNIPYRCVYLDEYSFISLENSTCKLPIFSNSKILAFRNGKLFDLDTYNYKEATGKIVLMECAEGVRNG